MGDSSGQIQERWSYDVFLSFRGPDVRNGFLSHLYKSLVTSGIYTFKDDEELTKGKGLFPELMKAIENSKIHLVVLSESYASSSWCLDELVKIMKCSKVRSTIVLPIFYKVAPADVRRQTGPFGESFDKHRSRHREIKLKRWKKALKNIANFKGYHISNG